MTPLEKIEKLLINDGKPSKDMIDYKIDQTVDAIINKLLNSDDQYEKQKKTIVKEASDINMRDNSTLQFYVKQKDIKWLYQEILTSLNRYDPYVKLDPHSDPQSEWKGRHPDNKNEITSVGFCLLLHITPEMKKSVPLRNKLESNLEDKPIKSKPKI